MLKTELAGRLDCLEGITHTLYLWPDGTRDITIYNRDQLSQALQSLELAGVMFNSVVDKQEFYVIRF